MYISYSDLPDFQNLFLDYVYEFENVGRFFKKNFRNVKEYRELFENLSEKPRISREQIIQIIRNQYGEDKPSSQTQINIKLLSQNKTFTVVTGQQLGLFGGPLYTFYKIITAIKLCQDLKSKFDSYNFVPVFWLEGDDHDFDEVRYVSLMNSENQIEPLYYNDGQPDETNRGKVSNIKFNEDIAKLLESLSANLRDTEFKQPLFDLISKCYSEGTTFIAAFRKLLFEIFDEYGLIIFDPTDPEIKKLLFPIFENELLNYREHSTFVLQQSAELEELYHAQVKVKPINLFLEEDDGRFLIEPAEGLFKLKGKRKKYTLEELQQILISAPERFSPNVLLRPICQDYLLPTAFYVGGPSEVSYFAQVIPLYEIFDIEQPYIYPRSSITIIEKQIQKILEKYEITLNDLFLDENMLNTRIVKSIADFDLESAFAGSKQTIDLSLDRLKENLFAVDATMTELTEKTREKIQQLIEGLKTKATSSQVQKHDTALRQISKARNTLVPNGVLQERVLNFSYFANKYGLDIIKWLMNEITIGKFEHQIIEL
ncbi:MAG: bacillithiol biosynthesis cysteine-adding enzyme BshC [bacterium]